jgi:hypothetical protein
MQVSAPTLQHEVMIEAVENHNPEVIVIDEIGRELEAEAARTIAERGVQLVATAHGRTLENLLLNPTLSDLVGGIESVTLSDEEARRRGTQKTVLERRAPPTFDVLIEIVERDRLSIHVDVAAAVDTLVRGSPLAPEIRWRGGDGELHVEHPAPPAPVRSLSTQGTRRVFGATGEPIAVGGRSAPAGRTPSRQMAIPAGGEEEFDDADERKALTTLRVFPYGVARNRLVQAAHRLGVPVLVVKDLSDADGLMTLKAYYRTRQQVIIEAEDRGLPIYVLRSNTISQIEQSLVEVFNLQEETPAGVDLDLVVRQTQVAIDLVMNGQRYVEMPPASAYVRRVQHEMARQSQLVSHSYGKEPNRRVRIFRE